MTHIYSTDVMRRVLVGTRLTCDVCGVEGPIGADFDGRHARRLMRRESRRRGWRIIGLYGSASFDFCPACCGPAVKQ